ncbi:receptor-like protein EIX2 [Silene latifolia]|uniref:receptor-like protein EIX2 n=1 Tax=Silene latifolia TaxID=37657 RepID=UPI003D781B0B
MSHTLLTLNLSSDWVPPFQLQSFLADSCKINGQLPSWLQTQKNLSQLILSDGNIFGPMPSWFHTMQRLYFVILSNNKISGSLIFPINFFTLDLSNNSLSGEFLSNDSKTIVYHSADFIVLSDNKLSGPLLEGLGNIMPNLNTLLLSNNQISGQIPNSLCQLTSLTALDINNNSLSGEIPNCFANLPSLSLVRLSNNKLKGNIPCFNVSEFDFNSSESGFNHGFVQYANGPKFFLHLNDNKFSGEIPSCLSDLTNLEVLDIGGNQLSGEMQKWFNAEKFIRTTNT